MMNKLIANNKQKFFRNFILFLPVLFYGSTGWSQVWTFCQDYSEMMTVSAPGYTGTTNTVSIRTPGTAISVTMKPGTATNVSWRIVRSLAVGEPLETLVAGGVLNSTLTYVSPGDQGKTISVYIDSIDGTATLDQSCRYLQNGENVAGIPTLSEWGKLFTGVGLAVAGMFLIRIRRRRYVG